jgi:hypothetical protein
MYSLARAYAISSLFFRPCRYIARLRCRPVPGANAATPHSVPSLSTMFVPR